MSAQGSIRRALGLLPRPRLPRTAAGRDRALAFAILLAVSLGMLLTAQMGFVRDEGYYFKAARLYLGWFERAADLLAQGRLAELADPAALKRHFDYNSEHPGAVKLAMGCSWKLFAGWLGWLSNATAMRVPGFVSSGLACALIYLLGVSIFGARGRARGRAIGGLAALLFILTPRTFFHGHLGAFDMPITALIVACVYAYLASLERPAWVWLGAALWGLALATKHNAAFLPLIFIAHWAWTRLPDFSLRRQGGVALVLPPVPAVLAAMLLVAPPIFLALYPSAWVDPFGRIYSYYNYHSHHEHYPAQYFGTLYEQPPFTPFFSWVMTAVTAPLPLVGFGVLGLLASLGAWASFPLRSALPLVPPLPLPSAMRLRLQAWVAAWRARLLAWAARPGQPAPADLVLLSLSALWPLALISLPGVPIFGGVKHWMPAMPFVALLAAWQLARLAEGLWELVEQRWPAAAVGAPDAGSAWPGRLAAWVRARGGAGLLLLVIAHLAVLPGLLGTAYSHPVQTAFYNEAIGGIGGAAALDMQRTFWGHDARPLFERLAAAAASGGGLYCDHLNYDSFAAYQQDELLPRRLHYAASYTGARWGLAFHMKEFVDNEYRLWSDFGTRAPRWVLSLDEVPLVSLYERGWQPR